MFGIGGFELFLILLFGFLIFGPDKLPAMARTLGKFIAKFRTAQEEMSGVLKNEVFDPNAEDPFKNPLETFDRATEQAKKSAADLKKAGREVSEARKNAGKTVTKAAPRPASPAAPGSTGSSAAAKPAPAARRPHLRARLLPPAW